MKKLFETIIADILSDSFFSEYKFRKSDNTLYCRTKEETLSIQLDHWRDDSIDSTNIYFVYGKRFEILTKWFEKFSFMTLQDQRRNSNVIFNNKMLNNKENELTLRYDFSDYKEKMDILLPLIKENISIVAKKYATLEDYYKEDVVSVMNGEKEFPDGGANWAFIDLTLAYLVDRDNYPKVKEKILERIEWMYDREEPNIVEYYGRLDEIISYMEDNVKL